MAYANGTTHYNLPLTVGSDKRDWADTNQAFADIDAAVYAAVTDTGTQEEEISALETRMDTAEHNISVNASDIAALDTRLTTAEGSITSQAAAIDDVRSDSEDMICAYNEGSATSTHAYSIGDYFIYNDVLYRATAGIAIGDTIVPDTNCTTTNVTTEIKEGIEDITEFKYSNPITNLAPAYDSTITYKINDIRSFIDNTYHGHLYRCTTAIGTPETFNPAHWEEINIIDSKRILLRSVTADGSTTWRNILNSLYSAFYDRTKKYIVEVTTTGNIVYTYTLSEIAPTVIKLFNMYMYPNDSVTHQLEFMAIMESTSAYTVCGGGTGTGVSQNSNMPAEGTIIRVYEI